MYGTLREEVDEDTPPAPLTPYGASKLAAEELVRAWVTEEPERSAIVVRPCVVFGERNLANMLNLIRQIDSGLFMLFGSGNNVKATAYVVNVVSIIEGLIASWPPGFRLYNYADKPDLTVGEIVGIIRQALGKKSRPSARRSG